MYLQVYNIWTSLIYFPNVFKLAAVVLIDDSNDVKSLFAKFEQTDLADVEDEFK